MDKKIISSKDGVKVFFSGDDVKKSSIINMVDNCQQNKCDCMSDDMKSNIKDMRITGVDGDVSLEIVGDIKIDDISKAMEKSKMINPSCCDNLCD